jgi:hypothetical protein
VLAPGPRGVDTVVLPVQQQPFVAANRKGTWLPRITLAFTISRPQLHADLLREFSLHEGVEARVEDVDGHLLLLVETNDSAGAMWDVRATIGMFDDRAVEVEDHA